MLSHKKIQNMALKGRILDILHWGANWGANWKRFEIKKFEITWILRKMEDGSVATVSDVYLQVELICKTI